MDSRDKVYTEELVASQSEDVEEVEQRQTPPIPQRRTSDYDDDQSPFPINSSTTIPSQDKEAFMRISGEERNKKSAKPRRPYSTTSSVYAEHSLSNPDNDQVIYCIGAILQAQIFDDLMNPDMQADSFPEFNLEVCLPPEYGGAVHEIPEQILLHETIDDLQLRSKLIEGAVPTVDTVYRFMKMLISCAQYSIECNILALVYINRITTRNVLSLTMNNWRGIWVSVIILAQKVWDDVPLKTSSFVQILPGVAKEHLRQLEMRTFEMLGFNTIVKPSVYAKYYFELRQLFLEISGGDPRFQWNMQPLSMVQGQRLKNRSNMQAYTHSAASRSSKSNSGGGSSSSVSATPVSTAAMNVSNTPRTQEDIIAVRSRFVLS